MKKKWMAVVLSVAMAATLLAGCGGSGGGQMLRRQIPVRAHRQRVVGCRRSHGCSGMT